MERKQVFVPDCKDHKYTFSYLQSIEKRYVAGEDIIINRDDTNEYLSKDDSCPTHSHDYIELAYIISGTGIQFVNGNRYAVQKGDIICMNVGDFHQYYPLKNLQILNCIISLQAFDIIRPQLPKALLDGYRLKLPYFTRMGAQNYLVIEDLFQSMEEEYIKKKPYYIQMTRTKMLLLLLEILRSTELDKNSLTINSVLWPVFEYISKNFSNIQLKDAAKIAGYSPTYFSRVFFKYMGVSYIKYVNHLKITRAKDLLANTQDTIEDICIQLGFKEKKQFYKLFKTANGMSPGKYRKFILQQSPEDNA